MTERLITVRETPGPQGSKRHVGNGVMIESSAKVKPWREAIKWAVIEAGGARTILGPIELDLYFTVRKPKSAPKKRRTWPDRKPDLDKLCRSTFDALTSSGVIEDDARVVRCLSMKVFPGEHIHALDVPGAVIVVRSAA